MSHAYRLARVAAGGYWVGFDAAQQAALAEAFASLSVATYAARFDGFSGEHFAVRGTTPAGRDAVLVANDLVKGDGGAVAINYMLRNVDGAWRIVDIYLDAKYSEVAVKRSEYSSVLKSEGLTGLLKRIADKVKQLKAGGA